MRRYIGSHTDSDTGSTVYQKIGITTGKNYRFLLCIIKVRNKINSVFCNISKKLHGNLRKSCFCVTHCSSTVTVHGTKVTMSVHQRISGRPVLRHIYESTINRTITVGMIFTHGIADNTCTFTMRLIRTVIQFYHRIKNTALYRLQTVSYIRKSTGSNDTHSIVYVECLHSVF